jgi:hypothetical protein
VIDVPVTVANEVAAMVYLKDGAAEKPFSPIIISFYNSNFTLTVQTITEPDGAFNYTAQTNTLRK